MSNEMKEIEQLKATPDDVWRERIEREWPEIAKHLRSRDKENDELRAALAASEARANEQEKRANRLKKLNDSCIDDMLALERKVEKLTSELSITPTISKTARDVIAEKDKHCDELFQAWKAAEDRVRELEAVVEVARKALLKTDGGEGDNSDAIENALAILSAREVKP